MKKFLPLLLAVGVFALTTLTPFVSAFAATQYGLGLLQGKTGYYNNLASVDNFMSGTTVTTLTDNDVNTKQTIVSNSYGVWYDIGSVKNISNVYVRSVTASTVQVSFYDGNKIGQGSLNVATNEHSNVTKNGIRYVRITSVSGSNDFTEFDVNVPIHDEISNLITTPFYNKVDLTWDIPVGNTHFTGSKIYRDGVLIDTVGASIDVYSDTNVLSETTYSYKVTATYDDSFESNGIVQSTITEAVPVDPALIPPAPITNLSASNLTGTGLTLNWINPSDTDLAFFNVYKDGVLYESTSNVVTSFDITGLSPNKNYSFSVSAVDVDGNEGTKVAISVTSGNEVDLTPPNVPTGVKVNKGNEALYVSWNPSGADDIFGYNVYVNGTKINSTIIKNNFYSVSGLDNGTNYDIQVSAIDTSMNESDKSAVISNTPSIAAIPIISTDYTLGDVAEGIQKWFTAYWPILAFAVSIPLSFYIASRVKLMFLD